MATLNGSTYLRRTLGLTGVSSSKLGLITGWFQLDDGEGGTILVGGAGATEYLKLSVSKSTGKLAFAVKNAAGSAIWDVVTTTATYDDGSHRHFAISMNLGAARGQVYVNAAAPTLTANTALTDDTIAYATATEWVVGADLAGATPFTGQLYDVVFWPGLSTDLSDVENLQMLVAQDSNRLTTSPSALKPVGYGSQGLDVGQTAAILFTSGFVKNVGTGGLFTLTGSTGEDVSTATEPSGYRFFPRWRTPGERWFPSEQSAVPYPRSQTFIEQREGLYSFGKRLGLDEMDATTRRERPGMSFSDMVLGIDEEDDDSDYLR